MFVITRGALSVLVLTAGCGGLSSSSSVTAVPPSPAPLAGAPPVLLGRPIWDRPLSDPMALRALERVRTALADKPPALQGSDPRMWLGPIQGWIEDRVKVTREVRADADALASDADPRMQLLASVVLGVAADDFVSDLLSIEPPAEFVAGDHGAETKAVFKETLERQAAPLSAAARVMLQKCVLAAPRAPAQLRQWEAYCRERDASLGELEARVAARETAAPSKPHSKPPALFADCDTKEVRHVDPDAPAPDLKAKPAVAYLYTYTGTDLQGDDARKLEQAVAAKLGLEVGMPVVSEKDVAAARTLVAQKRLHARAPACGQAPPLPAVIAHKRRHLIVGEIQTTCIWQDKTERCGLLVQYVRAGSDDNSGVPRALFAKVTSRDVPAADWLASVERLVPDEGAAGILGTLGTESKIFFEVANYRDDAPWLRLASTLDSDTQARLSACIDAPASFDATFTISPVGKTQKTALVPVTAPPADSKVDACVKTALDATAWPCPLDGKPAKVAVRLCVAPRPR